MGNKFFRWLLIGIVGGFAFVDLFAGPPPGAPGYGGQIAGKSEKSRAFHIDLGIYTPSLSMLNDDLKHDDYSSLKPGTYFDIGFLSNGSAAQKTSISFAYWSASSSNLNFTENLRLFMFQVSPLWELSGLSDAILPSGDLRVSLGLTMRDVVASVVKDEYPNGYIAAIGMAIDLGPALGLEYFPIRNSRSFSISANLDYILLNWNFLPLEISDYSTNHTRISVGDAYYNYKGQRMLVDTNGLILRLGVNFYY